MTIFAGAQLGQPQLNSLSFLFPTKKSPKKSVQIWVLTDCEMAVARLSDALAPLNAVLRGEARLSPSLHGGVGVPAKPESLPWLCEGLRLPPLPILQVSESKPFGLIQAFLSSQGSLFMMISPRGKDAATSWMRAAVLLDVPGNKYEELPAKSTSIKKQKEKTNK